MLSSAFFLGKDKDDNNSIRFTYRYIGRRTSPFSDPLLLLKSSILTSLYLHLFINSFNQTLLLLLLLLSRFNRVQLCATLEMAAHQAPPSQGFSRQEHWSGLPFPSPMHESEKWKWSRSVMSDSEQPHRLQPTRLFRPWDFPGKNTGVGCHFQCMKVKSGREVTQSCPTLSDPMDCSLPGSSIHGIF